MVLLQSGDTLRTKSINSFSFSLSPVKVSQNAIYKLTLLWAFAESGLGGLLHGFRLPITGLVLGGFSVLTISLIAHLSPKPGRDILQATIVVLSIKFAASPHSPLAAYIAVFFQGLLGALLFSGMGRTRLSVLLFAVVALLESAIQKPLVATLFFGTELWNALNEFANKLLSYGGNWRLENFSLWLVTLYTSVHLLWGAVLGYWAFRLPARIESIKGLPTIMLVNENNQQTASTGKKRRSSITLIFFFLIGLLVVMYTLPEESRWLYLGRSILIIAVVFLIITPLVKKLLGKWSRENRNVVDDYWQALPTLGRQVQAAWHLAKQEKNYAMRAKEFVLYCFWLTMFSE